MPPAPQPNWDNPILLGCAPSSGSTLLSVMLDAHPDILCGPELSLFSHPFFWLGAGPAWARQLDTWLDLSFDEHKDPNWEWSGGRGVCSHVNLIYPSTLDWCQVELQQVRDTVVSAQNPDAVVRTIYTPPLARTGKSYWAEKSPPNIYAFKAFLNRYPQGRGVIIVRDGRDVVCSLVARKWEFWRAAASWLLDTALAMTLARHPRVFILRYEDLVARPEQVLAPLCEFLGVRDAAARMANYSSNSERVHSDSSIRMKVWKSRPNEPIQSTSVGRWREELSPAHLSALSSARVMPCVAGLEECGNFSFPDVMKHFNYSLEGLEAVAGTDALALLQALPPPSFPPVFPQMYVHFLAPAGPPLLNSILFWGWSQLSNLAARNERLEKLLAVKDKEIADLQFKILCKSGKFGGLREFMGWNKKLEKEEAPSRKAS